MSNQTFQKWCVFVLFLTAALWISGSLLAYLDVQFETGAAVVGQWLRFGWSVFLVFALLAIYHFDLEKMGHTGLFAFVSAMFGSILNVIPEYLKLSSATGSGSAALELDASSPVLMIAALVYLLGYMWFGITIIYNGSLSKWGAIFFTLGSVIGSIPALLDNNPAFLPLLGALLGGAGVIWLGVSLRHKTLSQTA